MTQADFPNNDSQASPLVSLIVRTINRPDFLQEALQSICMQTYPNIEIVVINDGGEDVSAVVNDFARQVSALQLIQLPQNRGRSGAANQGLSAAKGEFIGFLDDDDTLDPDHIADLVQALHQHPQATVVYGGVRVEDDKGNVDGYFNLPFDRNRLLASNFIPIHALLFSHSLIGEGGARFDENMDVYEDWDFWLQLSLRTSFLHVDKISAVYRARGDSGVGLIANEDMQRQGREQLFDKWRLLWTGREINCLAEYALTQERKLAERDEQVANLNQAVAERDGQIANLNQAVAERDDHIANLNHIVAERDGQIANLNQAAADRDSHIANLNHIVDERVSQIANLNQAVVERDDLIASLAQALKERECEIRQILASTSWRLTNPLRASKNFFTTKHTKK